MDFIIASVVMLVCTAFGALLVAVYLEYIARMYQKEPDKYFRIAKRLAKHGWYKYNGDIEDAHSKHYPMVRIKYKDGTMSTVMPIGNGLVYERMFSGTMMPYKSNVVKIRK